jgi:hypothetical protein
MLLSSTNDALIFGATVECLPRHQQFVRWHVATIKHGLEIHLNLGRRAENRLLRESGFEKRPSASPGRCVWWLPE